MNVAFRRATNADFPRIATWLAKPHVNRWWRDPKPTVEAVAKHYGNRVAGNDPTALYIVLFDDTEIGIIQSYWVDDYPEHADSMKLTHAVGVDLFIGEETSIGKGYGTQLLTQFIADIVRPNYAGAAYVVADPEIVNLASIGAFAKAGFYKGRVTTGEYGPEQIMIMKL